MLEKSIPEGLRDGTWKRSFMICDGAGRGGHGSSYRLDRRELRVGSGSCELLNAYFTSKENSYTSCSNLTSRGKITVKVEPIPISDTSSILPWSSFTNRDTIANPKPVLSGGNSCFLASPA
jgi:hypothetical protein